MSLGLFFFFFLAWIVPGKIYGNSVQTGDEENNSFQFSNLYLRASQELLPSQPFFTYGTL